MRYYISDLHFYHESLNHSLDCRGFADRTAMNEAMIRKWNARVRDNDEVFILGDFSTGKGEATNAIVNRLAGKLYLLIGNHDLYLEDRKFDTSRFIWIRPYAEIHDDGRKVILSHYPVFFYNGQYRKRKDGSDRTYMLYGHVHDSPDEILVDRFQGIIRSETRVLHGSSEPEHLPCHMINCFCMYSDYTPLSLDEWIENDRMRREKMHTKENGGE